LSVARNDRIYRSRSTKLFILADDRRSGILGDHQPRIQTGIRAEKSRQSPASRNKLIGSSFGNAAQFGDSYRQKIQSQGQWLCMEIATRQNRVIIREYV